MTDPALPSMGAWDGSQFQVLDAQGQFDPTATAAALAAYVAANPPPAPVFAPVVAAAPGPVYISKVEFERRLLPAEFGRLDAFKIAIDNRPANWATSSTAPWPTYAPLVPAVQEFEDAGPDGINVNDAGLQTFTDYVAPAAGATDGLGNPLVALTSAQYLASRIAAILAS